MVKSQFFYLDVFMEIVFTCHFGLWCDLTFPWDFQVPEGCVCDKTKARQQDYRKAQESMKYVNEFDCVFNVIL